jgi:hypothetical protein
MGYVAQINKTDKSADNPPDLSYIARKKVFFTNKRKGLLTEYVQIQIDFYLENGDSSVITPHYVTEFNKEFETEILSEEQMQTYEKDFLTLKEKMYFYCDPRLKDRE